MTACLPISARRASSTRFASAAASRSALASASAFNRWASTRAASSLASLSLIFRFSSASLSTFYASLIAASFFSFASLAFLAASILASSFSFVIFLFVRRLRVFHGRCAVFPAYPMLLTRRRPIPTASGVLGVVFPPRLLVFWLLRLCGHARFSLFQRLHAIRYALLHYVRLGELPHHRVRRSPLLA